MHKLEIVEFFDAAHMLPNSKDLVTKKCANLHGHTYRASIWIYTGENQRNGMVVDFKAIKQIVQELDHTTILLDKAEYRAIEKVTRTIQKSNKVPLMKYVWLQEPPTAENIAKYLHNKIRVKYPDLGQIIVKVCEGYKGENTNYCLYWE